jgi:hypothetical protein
MFSDFISLHLFIVSLSGLPSIMTDLSQRTSTFKSLELDSVLVRVDGKLEE